MKPASAAALAALVAAHILLPATARAASESVYTKLEPDKNCVWDKQEGMTQEEKDEMLGNSAVCTGLPGYPVHFAEFDLRQFTAFGAVGKDHRTPGGFSEFNATGGTIEWRVSGGRPHATILRWFIDNANPQSGVPDEANRGQVLVISTVAQPEAPLSCPAGYVDARANQDANALARKVADTVASSFRCGVDAPVFHGVRGPLSGTPTDLAQ